MTEGGKGGWSARKMSGTGNERRGKMERKKNGANKQRKWSLARQQEKEAPGSPSTEKIGIYFSAKLFFTLPYNKGRAIVRIFSSFKLI